MFRKLKLKRQIKACKKKIKFFEQKRSRSQAALVEAILTHSIPDDNDVEFFNLFTEKINKERDKMHEFTTALEKLNGVS